MNFIEKLIHKLCPQGVEFKELGELGEFQNIGVDKKIIEGQKEIYLLNFTDIMKNNRIDKNTPQMIVTASDLKIQNCTIRRGDIFITPSSETRDEIGFASVATEDIPNACYSYHIMRFRLFQYDEFYKFIDEHSRYNEIVDITTSFFIRYLFESEDLRKQIYKRSTGLTRFGLSKQSWEKLKIPVPPLEIQIEIVKILDCFTKLEAELEAELEARRKQYEFYLNRLLNLKELEKRSRASKTGENSVKMLSLGEVCEKTSNISWKNLDCVIARSEATKQSKNITKNMDCHALPAASLAMTEFKYIDLTSVSRENKQIKNTQIINKNNAPSRAQQIVKKDDILFATTRPVLHRFCIVDNEFDGQICSTGFCVLRVNKNLLLPKWLFYCVATQQCVEFAKRHEQGTNYPAISDAEFKKFKIPVPALAVQNEVVSILDKFHTLVNDLKTGLPAEIALRKKQYAFYRDKLLNFKEKVS